MLKVAARRVVRCVGVCLGTLNAKQYHPHAHISYSCEIKLVTKGAKTQNHPLKEIRLLLSLSL